MRDLAELIYPYFKLEVDQCLHLTWRRATRRKRIRALYHTYDSLAQRVIHEAVFKDMSKQGRIIADALFFPFDDEWNTNRFLLFLQKAASKLFFDDNQAHRTTSE